MRTESPLLAPIFRSDGQARLLAASLLTDDELSISDLADRADLAYPTAHREVARLVEAGILRERPVGRVRLISADEASPLTSPLRAILQATMGAVPLLARELASVAGISSAFLYGSFAARLSGAAGATPKDIDLMVIGTPAAEDVYDACERAEVSLGRPVNPTIMTPDEFANDSGFLEHVRGNPRIPVIGELP